MGSLIKIIAICILPLVAGQYRTSGARFQQQNVVPVEKHDFLDIQSPDYFTFTPSPLQKPDSLRSRPYYDFLSTLYRHDQGKTSLFSQYPRSKREAGEEKESADLSPVLDALNAAPVKPKQIRKRAVVFRPLFVYRQQQIQRQKIEQQRKRY